MLEFGHPRKHYTQHLDYLEPWWTHFSQVSRVGDTCGAKYHQPCKINQRSL